MDFSDFFADMAIIGGEKRGWRSYFVIFTLIVGLGLGTYIGFQSDGLAYALGYGLIGGFFGWIGGVVLLGMMRFALIFVPLFLAALAIAWLTGYLG